MRKYFCTDIHLNSTVSCEEFIVFNGFEDFCQFISQKDRNNCRRSLVSTKTMIVSCTCNRDTEQICIIINCFDNSYKKYQELCVLSRCFTRIKKVDTSICTHGPVVVFTTSVDTFKWFFMKQAYHIMLGSNFFHDFHCQLVMIDCNVCCIEYRSQLMLSRSNFIMFCFGRNSKFPEFFIKIMHISRYTRLQSSEIMIFHFLAFWSRSTDQCTSTEDQVFSLIIKIFVYQKVFLFRTYGCVDMFDFGISEKTKNLHCFFIQSIHGTKKRCFLIQCLATVRTECCRDIKCTVFNKCR